MHSLFRGSRRDLVAGLCSGDEMTDRKKWCWFVYACSHPALLDFLHRPFASLHSPRTGARLLTSCYRQLNGHATASASFALPVGEVARS
jgi:hypothetical protein